jgi:hypothetical protein
MNRMQSAENKSTRKNKTHAGLVRLFFHEFLRSCAAPFISVAILAFIAFLYSGLVIVTGTSLPSHIGADTALDGAVALMLSGLGITYTFSGLQFGIPALFLTLIDIAVWVWMDRLFIHTHSSHQHLSLPLRVTCVCVSLAVWIAGWFLITDSASSSLSWNSTDVLLHSFLLGIIAIAIQYASTLQSHIRQWAQELGGAHLVRGLVIAFHLVQLTVIVLLSLSTVALIWLFCSRFSSVMNIVYALGMSGGLHSVAAVLLVILSIAWLPNLQIAILGWMSGGVFTIGQAGSVSLTSVTTHALPLFPIFGIIPQPLHSSALRTLLMILPGLCAGIVALIVLIRYVSIHDSIAANAVESLYAFISASIAVALILWIWMIISTGSLGTGKLAVVGLSFSQSFAPLLRPILLGYVIAGVLVVGSHALIKHMMGHKQTKFEKSAVVEKRERTEKHEQATN